MLESEILGWGVGGGGRGDGGGGGGRRLGVGDCTVKSRF